MNQYSFLFALALVYVIFASVQDLRKREVANWLSFSLIAFALSYRLFYSAYFGDYMFFVFGLLGFALFFGLANAFYYSKVFAGGDAKLLMGIGAVMPFQSYWDLLFLSITFIFVLFFAGMIFSLLYSIPLALRHKEKFKKEFVRQFRSKYYVLSLSLAGFVIIFLKIIYLGREMTVWWFFALLFIFVPTLYIYLEAINASCMIRLVDARELTEGDWLKEDISVGGKVIKKNVHGLSIEEIKFLKKHRKKALIRYGVPFVPSFMIALLIMVFFFSILKIDFQSFFSSLF